MKPNASKEAKAAFFRTTIVVIILAAYCAMSAPAGRAQVSSQPATLALVPDSLTAQGDSLYTSSKTPARPWRPS